MLRLIRACYEIRAICGRMSMGLKLSSADRALLARLQPLFKSPDGQRKSRRMPSYTPVSFRTPSGLLTEGVLTDLSLLGAFVETPSPLPVGAITALRTYDPASAREY